MEAPYGFPKTPSGSARSQFSCRNAFFGAPSLPKEGSRTRGFRCSGRTSRARRRAVADTARRAFRKPACPPFPEPGSTRRRGKSPRRRIARSRFGRCARRRAPCTSRWHLNAPGRLGRTLGPGTEGRGRRSPRSCAESKRAKAHFVPCPEGRCSRRRRSRRAQSRRRACRGTSCRSRTVSRTSSRRRAPSQARRRRSRGPPRCLRKCTRASRPCT